MAKNGFSNRQQAICRNIGLLSICYALSVPFLPDSSDLRHRFTRTAWHRQRSFSPSISALVEGLSIDEAFLDVTGSVRLFGKPEDIARKIKETVFKETGLTVSAGVALSKFVAKIDSDMDKPDGLTVVHPDRVREFLYPLPICPVLASPLSNPIFFLF